MAIEKLETGVCLQCGRQPLGRVRIVRVAHVEVCDDCLAEGLLVACGGSWAEAADVLHRVVRRDWRW